MPEVCVMLLRLNVRSSRWLARPLPISLGPESN